MLTHADTTYTGRRPVIEFCSASGTPCSHIAHAILIRGGPSGDLIGPRSFRMCQIRLDRTLPDCAKRFRFPLALPRFHNLTPDPSTYGSPFLGLITVAHPFCEKLNAGLRPRTLSSRRRWRHDSPANPANAIVDHGGMRFYIIVVSEIERLAHRVDVPLRKKRENIGVKAGQSGHESKNLKEL